MYPLLRSTGYRRVGHRAATLKKWKDQDECMQGARQVSTDIYENLHRARLFSRAICLPACLPYSRLQSSAAALSGFPPTHPLSSPLLLPFPYYSFRKYLLHNYSLSGSGETLMNELTGSLSRWRAWNKLKTGCGGE